MFLDDLTHIAIIWSSIAVFNQATREVIVSQGIDPLQMIIYGASAAFLLTVVGDVIQIEQIYVALGALATIMLWAGMHRP